MGGSQSSKRSSRVKPHSIIYDEDAAEKLRQEEQAARRKIQERERLQLALALIVQSSVRAFFARKIYEDYRKKAVGRRHIAKEILQTEESYVKSLLKLQKNFYEPFKSSGLLESAQLKIIFPQLQTIIQTNETLLVRLKERIDEGNWKWTQCVGDIFLEMIDFFKVYMNYVNSYNQALTTISNCRKTDSAFDALIEQCNNAADNELQDLFSFLIMPIQRIPRYVLLLEDLLKKTPNDHVDYEKLAQGTAKVKAIADQINRSKQEADNFQELLKIYESVRPEVEDLIQPHRFLLASGVLTDYSDDKHRAGKDYHFFLFNDFFMKTSLEKKEKKRVHYNFKSRADLRECQVVDLPAELQPGKKLRFAFTFTGGPMNLVLSAKSQENKDKWVKAIRKAIAENEKRLESFHAGRRATHATKTLKASTDGQKVCIQCKGKAKHKVLLKSGNETKVTSETPDNTPRDLLSQSQRPE